MFLNKKGFSKSKMVYISIVIPVYNEEESITELHNKIKETLENINKDYEIIFVDDGSNDKTLEILDRIHQSNDKVKAISFQRNFGKSAALSVGFKEAAGDIVITMDADLQDDPQEIKRFIEKLNEGYDMVSGWKYKRKDPLTKRIPSKFFNFLTRVSTGIKIHDFNCGFKAYKKEVIKNIKIYGELHRYIPVIAKWNGFKVGEIKVLHHQRKYGKSKYGSSRLFKGFLDLITIKFLATYSKRPLHLFGIVGILLGSLGFIIGLYLSWGWIRGIPIGNRPLLFLSMLLLLMGLQFFSIGLLGEIVTFNKENEYNIKKRL